MSLLDNYINDKNLINNYIFGYKYVHCNHVYTVKNWKSFINNIDLHALTRNNLYNVFLSEKNQVNKITYCNSLF